MSDKKKFEDNQPGMDQKREVPNSDLEHTREAAESGNQGRASYHAGSTVQGGSNYGQGSYQLGGESHHQGETRNEGATYENERGKLATENGTGEFSRKDDPAQTSVKGKLSEKREDIPHGHGAHVNEKESNAQEDYPGPDDAAAPHEEPEKDII